MTLNIDWDLVTKIAVPLGTLVLGKYLDQWFAKRPRLVTYLGHASAFTLRGTNPTIVHTHAIVVLNAGRETAKHVRIGHFVLPEHYQLHPAVPHTINRDPNGIAEIVLSQLVPNEQVTVNYLYWPPLLWSQIHAYTKSDEGFAKVLNVLPTPQMSRWVRVLIWTFVFVGAMTLLYLIAELVRWLVV